MLLMIFDINGNNDTGSDMDNKEIGALFGNNDIVT
jgi:hypothetical protein